MTLHAARRGSALHRRHRLCGHASVAAPRRPPAGDWSAAGAVTAAAAASAATPRTPAATRRSSAGGRCAASPRSCYSCGSANSSARQSLLPLLRPLPANKWSANALSAPASAHAAHTSMAPTAATSPDASSMPASSGARCGVRRRSGRQCGVCEHAV